ncbi:MAG TPA: T9SS type A sorting domain-containing protein [Bacteroidia bacterium]|nr:T9SS type A sorting domain-containing protein [Bacteroidia bacterium]
MKNLLRITGILLLLFIPKINSAQCTITNATSCVCKDGSSNCDLLPDLTISWYGLQNYSGGPTEYPQTGAGADDGHLRVSGSTPNIGYGPFTVEAEQNGNHMFVCGTDTFTAPASQSFVCPNGEVAKQILWQRIYHKDHQAMSFRDRIAGAMTYQQGSLHVDDWGIMSLRIEDPLDPNPLHWSVLGWGHKQSFCLMDYGSCSTYSGHCRDDQSVFGGGTVLLNADFPNYGLGNSYGCSAVEQGCSVGYTDIYSESLNGMFIEIPPGTCNGNYWIVYELDPHNYFEESNENNNYTVMPFTLTLQDQPGNPVSTITASQSTVICGNDSVTLTANAGLSYAWSNGATTQNIRVGAGTYTVTVTTYCGSAVSQPLTITALPAPAQPVVSDDSICSGYSATLTCTGNNISWYDQNNILVGTGNSYTTPVLINTTSYYAIDEIHNAGVITHGGKTDSLGGGGYYTGIQYEIFDALKPFVLKSVQVFANGAGPRTFELYNSSGTVLQSGTYNIPNGPSRVTLNFNVPPGTNLRLGATGTPNLWRNNVGVVYPYTLTDTLSITGSSAGAAYYYFFYDWEIEIGGGICSSTPALANAVVIPCTGINPAADLSNNLTVYPNPSSGIVNVDMVLPGNGSRVEIYIYDMTGRKAFDRMLSGIAGKHSEALDLSSLSKGVYQLVILIEGRRYVRRVDIR